MDASTQEHFQYVCMRAGRGGPGQAAAAPAATGTHLGGPLDPGRDALHPLAIGSLQPRLDLGAAGRQRAGTAFA